MELRTLAEEGIKISRPAGANSKEAKQGRGSTAWTGSYCLRPNKWNQDLRASWGNLQGGRGKEILHGAEDELSRPPTGGGKSQEAEQGESIAKGEAEDLVPDRWGQYLLERQPLRGADTTKMTEKG